VVWILLYFIQVKNLIPNFLKIGKIKEYVIWSIVSLVAAICVLLPIELIYLQDMWYRRYYVYTSKIDYLINFKWYNFNEMISGLVIVYVLIIIYGMIRHAKFPDDKFFKKILPIAFSAIVVLTFSVFLTLIIIGNSPKRGDHKFKTTTNNSNIFIKEAKNVSQLLDVLPKTDSIGKLKCVVFWSPGCGSQFDKIKQIDRIKSDLNSGSVEFIYLCGDYKDDRDFWLDFIYRENITGLHYYLIRQDFHKILINELGINTGVEQIVLLDENNRILNKSVSIERLKQELSKKVNIVQ
jgi:hypothetical protein